ncbi:glutathione ABC transporter substrate-binding protein [Alkalicoccobacillus murimartini]|uniref:Peptide/nickel transport system substrate-binding protein n=1 Tax=Alkalicoccobacillus murimartini TaxID=171685 RepID=A0ABT9YNJ5_9BACI|nr:glutathione ABC transporter substrate-binding protein [Alkalicoccobacillus murimartini]MDQ0209336.1 peptide/nickel transport system substrate-binding protein [Alkalicoccobacillus murimartini]
MKKSYLLLVLLTAGLAACASEPQSSGSENEASSDSQGGDLVIDMGAEAVSLDPHLANDVPSGNVASNIFDRLVTFDGEMNIENNLAKHWEQVDDLTLRFELEEGVTFHDGEPFDAEAVKANIERITDPDIASPRGYLFTNISEVDVVDEYTVDVKTEEPFAPLIYSFAHNGGGMISPKAIEEDYAAMEEGKEPGSVINSHPVGSSYFEFESWTTGQEIKLVNNEDYWGEPAKLDSVTFKTVPEDGTRLADLETGSAHVSDPFSPSDVERVMATDGLDIIESNSMGIEYIGFNTQKAPFDDKRVRQAISMAVDNEAIIENLLNGYGVPAIGPMSPQIIGFDDTVEPLEYDPEKAKELLAEAGYPDGFETSIWTNDKRERVDLVTYLQQELGEIGITVETETMEWGSYLDQTNSGDHDMFVLGWSASTGDADYALSPLFHSMNHGAAGNKSFLDNEEVDQLLEDAQHEMDEEVRMAMYKEVQDILIEEAPLIYTHHKQEVNAISDSVKNLWRHQSGDFQLHEVYIEE